MKRLKAVLVLIFLIIGMGCEQAWGMSCLKCLTYCCKAKKRDINELYDDGFAKIHKAARDGDDRVIGRLWGDGANLDIKSRCGFTPLTLAVKECRFKAALTLLDYDADPSIPSGDNQWTALHWAVFWGHDGLVKIILERAKVLKIHDELLNARTTDGDTDEGKKKGKKNMTALEMVDDREQFNKTQAGISGVNQADSIDNMRRLLSKKDQ